MRASPSLIQRLLFRFLRAAGLVLMAFGLVWAVAVPLHSAKEVRVNMQRFAFIPEGQLLQANVTIDAGDTVTWVYNETANDPTGCGGFNPPLPAQLVCPGHSTTSTTGLWDSKVFGKTVPPSQVTYPGTPPRFSVRFDTPGTYAYICTVHQSATSQPSPFNQFQGMRASVIVNPGPGGAGPSGAPPTPLTRPLAATGIPSIAMNLGGLALLYASWRLRRSLLTA